MRLNPPTAVLLFICLFVINDAFSQTLSKKNDKKTFERRSVVVKANVAVVDASGKLLDNVKLDDLKIFEDGIEQKLSHFVKKDSIINSGLVFDNSGSMRKNLDEIIKLKSVFADLFLPGGEVLVIRFVDNNEISIEQEWTADKKSVEEAINNMYVAGGRTALLDAVYLTASKLLERERKAKSQRFAIVLISDGEERDSYYGLEETLSLFKNTDIQIFVLSFAETAPLSKKKARSVGSLLALETGGTTYAMPKKHNQTEIVEALKKIAGELRAQYIISYTSINQKRDGLQRKLSVQVADGPNGEKRQGLIRESFVVPKD